jgi:hypothetical protein
LWMNRNCGWEISRKKATRRTRVYVVKYSYTIRETEHNRPLKVAVLGPVLWLTPHSHTHLERLSTIVNWHRIWLIS